MLVSGIRGSSQPISSGECSSLVRNLTEELLLSCYCCTSKDLASLPQELMEIAFLQMWFYLYKGSSKPPSLHSGSVSDALDWHFSTVSVLFYFITIVKYLAYHKETMAQK